jgi:glycosyltransferase involved in cell wall biosynthesis
MIGRTWSTRCTAPSIHFINDINVMLSDPLVSIVITNYNYGRYLAEAIDSALTQSYGHCEVIVVDDGSTDDSREVIARYEKRIVPVLKENGGQGSSFNAGFVASHGEIVCFLDADDALYGNAVATAVAAFADCSVAKVHWPLEIVGPEKRATGERFPNGELLEGNLSEQARQVGPLYDSRWMPPTSGNAWSRALLKQVLPMPANEFDHGADVYLHTLAPLFGEMRAVKEPLGMYRAHPSNHYWRNPLTESKVTEYLGRFESCCTALERHLAAIGERPRREEWERRNFNYLWLTRLQAARRDLARIVPPGESLILVDDDEWGPAKIVGRRTVPFLEQEGNYWGPPADDDQAIRELMRMRQRGARYIAFWWTCFWWLEQYAAFHEHLRSHFPCVLDNDRLVAFDLTRAAVESAIAYHEE